MPRAAGSLALLAVAAVAISGCYHPLPAPKNSSLPACTDVVGQPTNTAIDFAAQSATCRMKDAVVPDVTVFHCRHHSSTDNARLYEDIAVYVLAAQLDSSEKGAYYGTPNTDLRYKPYTSDRIPDAFWTDAFGCQTGDTTSMDGPAVN